MLWVAWSQMDTSSASPQASAVLTTSADWTGMVEVFSKVSEAPGSSEATVPISPSTSSLTTTSESGASPVLVTTKL